MKRKQLFLVLSSLVCAIIIFSPQTFVVSSSSSPPSGKTGSIGDAGATCTGCHGGGSATAAPGWVTSNIPVSGYAPGTTYTINVIAADSNAQRIGFEATAENAAGDKVGSLIVTDGSRTGLVGMDYIGHVTAGLTPVAPGANAWTFDWTAPSSGTGDVTFYAAVNAANGDFGTSGDVIYTSSLTVQEDSGAPVSVQDDNGDLDISIYPNPATVHLLVDLGQAWRSINDIKIYDMNGSLVLRESVIGAERVRLNIESLNHGTYFVISENRLGMRSSQKVVIQ